jgi:hypothetical protein
MKNAVFWAVATCRYCVNRRFRGTYRFHLQGIKIRERGTNVSRWLQTAGWVGPRAGLYDVEKRKFLTLPELELRSFDYPARSQSLYRLRYHYPVYNIFCMLPYLFKNKIL